VQLVKTVSYLCFLLINNLMRSDDDEDEEINVNNSQQAKEEEEENVVPSLCPAQPKLDRTLPQQLYCNLNLNNPLIAQ
jgi:hypothetical protein